MPTGGLRISRPIALVGLAGSGKTQAGRRLSERLGVPFIDSDAEIERGHGRSISHIFIEEGEAAFRQMERRFLLQSSLSEPQVIATGGGAFFDPAIRAHLLTHCLTVWLDTSLEELAERIDRSGDRPLLRGKEARGVLQQQAMERNSAYAQAHLRIDGNCSIEELVDQIMQALRVSGE